MQGGGEFRGWDHQTYLLAGVVNLLNAANRQRAGKKAKPIVKPPTRKTKTRTVTVAEIAAAREARKSRTSDN